MKIEILTTSKVLLENSSVSTSSQHSRDHMARQLTQGLSGAEDLRSSPLPTGEPAHQEGPPLLPSPCAPMFCRPLHVLAGLGHNADGISFQAALAVTVRNPLCQLFLGMEDYSLG